MRRDPRLRRLGWACKFRPGDVDQTLRQEWLGDEGDVPCERLAAPVAGDHDDREVRVAIRNLAGEVDAVQIARHVDVSADKPDFAAFAKLEQCPCSVARRSHWC
jgi:hypothetical protein